MPRATTFSSGLVVSSKFLNDVQQGLAGATFGGYLAAHSSDVTKVSLIPGGHEVVAPIVMSSGTGATAGNIAADYAVGYRENTVNQLSATSGGAGSRNIWATTTTAAQTTTAGTYEISALPTGDLPVTAFQRRIGTAEWSGTALSTGRLLSGVKADANQTNMFTFKSMFDTVTDIPLTLQGGVAQGASSGVLLSVGYLVASAYSQKWSLGAKGRIVSYPAAASDDHYRAHVGTDANPVMALSSKIQLGPGGASAVDTTVERTSVGVVKVTDTIDVISLQNSTASGPLAGAVNVLDALNATGGLYISGTAIASTHLTDTLLLARLANPTFTGVPAAPTAPLDTNTTQLATTAFVLSQIAGGAAEIAVSKLADGAAYDVLQTNADGTTVAWVTGLTNNHISASAGIEISKLAAGTAPAGTYAFTSATLTAATQTAGNSSTNVATTAFVGTAGNAFVLKTGGTMTGVLSIDPAGAGTQMYLDGSSVGAYDSTTTLGIYDLGPGGLSLGHASAGTDWNMYRSSANVASLGAGDKLQQNAAPTVGDDLTNKTYVDAMPTSTTVVTSSATTITLSSPITLLTSAAAIAVTVPSAATFGAKSLTVKATALTAGNKATLTPAAGTIEGAATYVLQTANDSVTLVNDGTNWFAI